MSEKEIKSDSPEELIDLENWIIEMLAFQRANLVLLIISLFIVFMHVFTDVVIHI